MMRNIFSPMFMNQSIGYGAMMWWLMPLLLWSLIWKGLALWKAARNHHLYWFLVLLVLNTAGFLEILYLAFFQKKSCCQNNSGCCCCAEETPKIKLKRLSHKRK